MLRQTQVVYKRPTELVLKGDVPICCNLLVADLLDDTLLAAGLVPCISHCLATVCTSAAVVLPAAATVYAQPVRFGTLPPAGLDLSALDRYRCGFLRVCVSCFPACICVRCS